MMSRFFVACPKGVSTGGPEALHQLVFELRNKSQEAYLWDPETKSHGKDASVSYESYGDLWTEDEPSHSDYVILPETMCQLIPQYYLHKQLCVWWLSVDNFFAVKKMDMETLLEFPRILHLFQSEYARQFLEEQRIQNSLRLTDYINLDFLDSSLTKSNIVRDKTILLAVNPAKGFERTSQILEKLEHEKVVLLENLTRQELIKALSKSKIYLDLGHHPGKDRIPREAALLNCVVVTNQRGSANFELDVSLNRENFKINDSEKDFVDKLIQKLEKFDSDFIHYLNQQETYKNKIYNERDFFRSEVENLIKKTEELSKSDRTELDVNPKFKLLETLAKQSNGLIHERDGLIHERDGLIHERDGLIHERDGLIDKYNSLISSKSWKATAFLRKARKLSRLFKI